MVLWTIQPAEVYRRILWEGYYRFTDAEDEGFRYFPLAYGWMNEEMKKRVGTAPAGAVFPLFGWLRWETGRIRPDLLWMRWHWGPRGQYVLMKIDLPEDQVMLIDAESWSCIQNKGLLADSEEEFDRLYALFDVASREEKEKMLRENWQRAFNIEYAESNWRDQGYEVNAVFWELRKDRILSANHFTSVVRDESDIE